jgi:hypothetical protein
MRSAGEQVSRCRPPVMRVPAGRAGAGRQGSKSLVRVQAAGDAGADQSCGCRPPGEPIRSAPSRFVPHLWRSRGRGPVVELGGRRRQPLRRLAAVSGGRCCRGVGATWGREEEMRERIERGRGSGGGQAHVGCGTAG